MIFDEILDSIENEDMHAFAKFLIHDIPPYFWEVGASSTGKYHPSYALGELGLARHTVALVRFLNHTFEIECMNKWTSRERDMLRIAGMMHDSRKSGSQEDYENNKYTKFDHPLLAAEVVRSYKGWSPTITDEEIEIIATAIESHMGQWNTDKRSSVVLPKPTNKYQKMIHWADYLASRKDIEIIFDDNPDAYPIPNIEDYKLTFGKYKDWTIPALKEVDLGYLKWIKNSSDMGKKEPLKTFLADI